MTSKDYIKAKTEINMALKSRAIKSLQEATGLPAKEIEELLEVPPDPKLGDLAFPCFVLAKKFKKPPGEVALKIREKLVVPKGFKKVEVAGPYLNFFYDEGALAREVLTTKLKKKKIRKVVVVEFLSPNTNKPLHLGHLRNLALGESVSRIFEFLGWKVKRVNLYNDRGIHICKSMLAYMKWGRGKKPNKKPDHFVGDFYVLFSKKAKENPNLEEEARELLKKWEAGDPKVRKVWERMNSWAYKGFKETISRFGVKFDKNYYESQTYEKGKKLVLDGVKKGLFERDETGAIIVDLEGEGLGKKVLIRKDGTTVYITQDLYLALQKFKDFKFDLSIYVVASDQNYHFKVLFTLLKFLGYRWAEKCYHLSYGMVYLPSGKMKSREGTIVGADDLLDEIEEKVLGEVKKRKNVPKSNEKEIVRKISLGAVKYFLLKYDAKKDFTFLPEKSISLEGDTGPYLQYALVRANKILEKAGKKQAKNLDFKKLSSPEEKELIKHIAKFTEVVEKAAEQYSPHVIANYSYELAQKFARFYEKHRVVGSEAEAERLLLVRVFRDVLKKALHLLGVEEAEVM